jgi:hypothetical protein
LESTEAKPEWALRAMRVMIRTPSLRARNTEKHLTWMSVLEPLVTTALAGPESDQQFRARGITLCALTCLGVASAEWVHRGGDVAVRQLLNDAFQLL